MNSTKRREILAHHSAERRPRIRMNAASSRSNASMWPLSKRSATTAAQLRSGKIQEPLPGAIELQEAAHRPARPLAAHPLDPVQPATAVEDEDVARLRAH